METRPGTLPKPVRKTVREDLYMPEFKKRHRIPTAIARKNADRLNRKQTGSVTKIAGRVALAGLAAATSAGIIDLATGGDPVGMINSGQEVATDAGTIINTHLDKAGENLSLGNKIYGKYLSRQEDGSLVISETPEIVSVHYAANGDPTTDQFNQGKIVVRKTPEVEIGGTGGDLVSPTDIGTSYAISVAGGTYGSALDTGRFDVEFGGNNHTVGEWFMPTNDKGIPVGLRGEPLKEGESPNYIAAPFVVVSPTPDNISTSPANY